VVKRSILILLVLLGILIPGIALAQSAFNPVGFFTWLLGAIWQQPKVFEVQQGAYWVQKMRAPRKLVGTFGPTVIVDPSSRLGTMSQAGIKMATIGDFGWITDADVEFHKNRDSKVEEATVEITFNPMTKSGGNVTPKLTLWREQFHDVNGAEIRVFPPKSVDQCIAQEWAAVVNNSEATGEIIILTVNTYVEKPVKLKASQSFQVFVYPAKTLAKTMGFIKSGDGLGVALYEADKQDKQQQREQSGKTVKILVRASNSSVATSYRPVALAIYDSLGEVYRGEVSDGQTFKVLPESKSQTIRITELEKECPLGMIPETPIDCKTQRQTGYVAVVEGSEIMVYPIDNYKQIAGNCEPAIIKGEIKVYAQKGSQIPLEISAQGENTTKTCVNVTQFGGKTIHVWSDKPQSEMTVTAYTRNGSYSKKLTPQLTQAVFDFETKSPIRSYSAINTKPAVPGGINSRDELRVYAGKSHFCANVGATGVDPKEMEIFRQQAQAGQCGYTIVGPEVRTFTDNGSTITSANLIKSLTECGPNGQPIGHQTFYQTTFKSWHRVWVPKGRYGWVPGIISTCGNAVMVYIQPPTIKTPSRKNPLALGLASSSEQPMAVSWNDLVISVVSIEQKSLVVTPSSIAPYIPQAYTNIELNQNNNQSQGQSSTNVNNNFNDNDNINSTNVDVDNTNINQNQQIMNGAQAQ